MATTLTVTPCDKDGNTITRSIRYQAVEEPNYGTDEVAHVKIRLDDPDKTTSDTKRVDIKRYVRIGSGETYSVGHRTFSATVRYNRDYVYEYKCSIFDILKYAPITWPSSAGDWVSEVTYTISPNDDDTIMQSDVVSYNVNYVVAKEARKKIGYPRLTDFAATKGKWNSGTWVDTLDANRMKIYAAIASPAGLAGEVRAYAEIYARNQGVPYLTWSGQICRLSAGEYPTERTTSNTVRETTDLNTECKLIIYLQYKSPKDSDYVTGDTIVQYMSYRAPVFAPNELGTGVAFGMAPSASTNKFEVTSNWECDFNGTVNLKGGLTISNSAKAAILDAMFPVGSMIFATSNQQLVARMSAMGGVWSVATAYWIVDTSAGTQNVYVATRIQ